MAGVRQDAERTILTTVRSQAEMKTLGAVSAPGRNERRKKKKMVGWVERVGVWKEFLEPRGGGAKTCGEVLIQGELGDAEIRNKVIPPRKINSS